MSVRPLFLLAATLSLASACVMPELPPSVSEDGLCETRPVSVSPTEGADGVFLGDGYDRLELSFDGDMSLPSVVVTVAATGEEIDGYVTPDGRRATWTPYEPLPAETAIEVSYGAIWSCDHVLVTRFTTGPWTAEFDAPDWDDRAFVVTPGPADETPFGEIPLGFGLWSTDADLAFLAVPLDGWDGQDTCHPTVDLGLPELAAPDLALGPFDLTFGWQGVDVRSFDVTIQGLLRPDGTGLDRVTTAATVDLSIMGASCEMLESVDLPCGPCPDGGGACARIVRHEGRMDPDRALSPIVRTEADVRRDDRCDW